MMTTKLLDTSMKSFEGSEPCGFIDRGKAYTLVSYRARMLSPPYSLTRAAGLTPYVRAFFHPPPTPGAPRRALYPWQGPSNSLYFFLEGVAEAALYCAHRTSTIYLFIDPSKLACFSSFGMAPVLVPLRPSNEHILIVRVPGARDRHGCHSTPPPPFV